MRHFPNVFIDFEPDKHHQDGFTNVLFFKWCILQVQIDGKHRMTHRYYAKQFTQSRVITPSFSTKQWVSTFPHPSSHTPTPRSRASPSTRAAGSLPRLEQHSYDASYPSSPPTSSASPVPSDTCACARSSRARRSLSYGA